MSRRPVLPTIIPIQKWAGAGKPHNVTSADLPFRFRKWVDKDPTSFHRADNPASWVTDEAAWERAKKIVRKRWADYDEPWAVTAFVYKQIVGD